MAPFLLNAASRIGDRRDFLYSNSMGKGADEGATPTIRARRSATLCPVNDIRNLARNEGARQW
jgi:hypothetical protein